jgi:predicted Zn-dependent peptidase
MSIIAFTLLFLAILSFGGQKVMEKSLSNGIKIIVKETEGKGIVSGVIFVKGGKHGEEIPGLTHLTFTMLLKGTKSYPTSYDVSFPFEKYGGYIYSSSGDDFSEIGFAVKAEGFKEALAVLRELLTEPLFREQDLEREKKNTIVAIRSRRERGMELAMDSLRKLTFRGTPYETHSMGTEESVQRILREDLVKRFKELIRGSNIVVSIAGDMPAEEVFEAVSKALGDIPPGGKGIASRGRKIRKSEVIRVKRPGTQATILCAFNAPSKKEKDYFTFKVLTSILGDGMTSKLFRILREERGYAYATYAFYPTRLLSPRLFAYVGTSPEKKEEALRDLLTTVKDPPITAQDVRTARNKIIGDFLLDHQTRIRQAWYLGFYEVLGLGWKMDQRYTERIRRVTLKDVKRAVKKYIKDHHCVVVEP